MPIAELGNEKVFPPGGKNYKHKKLNREKVSALPTKEVIAFPLSGKVSALPTEEVCTVESVPPSAEYI